MATGRYTLTLTNISPTEVKVRVQVSSWETARERYDVFYSTSASEAYGDFVYTSQDSDSEYSVNGLTPNTYYYFHVYAFSDPTSTTPIGGTAGSIKTLSWSAPSKPTCSPSISLTTTGSYVAISATVSSWGLPDSGSLKIYGYDQSTPNDARLIGSTTSRVLAANDYDVVEGKTYVYFSIADNGARQSFSSDQIITVPVRGKVRVRVNGAWREGIPYVRTNGVWKKGKACVRSNGAWKVGS